MTEASDVLNMSDEEFMKNPPIPELATAVEKVETTPETVVVGNVEPEVPAVAEMKVEKEAPTKQVEAPQKKEKAARNVKPAAAQPTKETVQTEETDDVSEGDEGETEGDGDAVEVSSESVDPDYEGFYKQIMTPFKANGRTVELKTPQEAIQLMQMGANYTKKMQELVPHRKMITMLQNNGLLDEGKLSYLIDLDKKNPEAIKKLLMDAKIDPQEIDTSVEANYREGNHRVTDNEVAFSSALEDMKSSPEKLGTLQVINGEWDQASKEALWNSPSIMSVIHDQREKGIYGRIVSEVSRLRMLGDIPEETPFLQAYKIVGDKMTEANAFADLYPRKTPAAKTVVATRVQAPKPKVTNGDRAAAASSNRSVSGTSKTLPVNPLGMSDEAFMKQFHGRV
jgi:hypothetical protein